MRRGPKSIPTPILIADGGQRRRPNPDEPMPPVRAPDMPEFLDAYAVEEWRFIVPQLVRLGVASILDRAVIAAYCMAFSRWRTAEEIVQRAAKKSENGGLIIWTKTGNVMQSPIVGVANVARRDMIRAASELGLTPAARAGLRVENDDEDAASKRYGL